MGHHCSSAEIAEINSVAVHPTPGQVMRSGSLQRWRVLKVARLTTLRRPVLAFALLSRKNFERWTDAACH